MPVVRNESKAYGYNYASLADIVNQGFEIPLMKVQIIEGKEYIFYYHKDLKEWLQGAQVIIPQGKGMNASQQYGAGLSYARRYTTMLYLGLASDDDVNIEQKQPTEKEISKEEIKNLREQLYSQPVVQSIKQYTVEGLTLDQLGWICKHKNYKSMEEITQTDKEDLVRQLNLSVGAANGK